MKTYIVLVLLSLVGMQSEGQNIHLVSPGPLVFYSTHPNVISVDNGDLQKGVSAKIFVDGVETLTLGTQEFVESRDSVATSANTQVFAVLIHKVFPGKQRLPVAFLVLRKDDSGWRSRRVPIPDHGSSFSRDAPVNFRFIEELGAVNDDGTEILFKVGVAHFHDKGMEVIYTWQLRRLADFELLGEGLTTNGVGRVKAR